MVYNLNLNSTFQAVLVDRTLYISGQLGMDPKTMDFVEGGVEEQAIQAQYIYQDSTLNIRVRSPRVSTQSWVDVLCRQPIKLFQVVSTSEFHEY